MKLPACLGLLLLPWAVQAATVPYSTDFEGALGPEWSNTSLDNTYPSVFTRFSGRFSNHSQALTLSGFTPGQSYTVGFDLYVLDSWDGNNGPDTISVNVDGTELFHYTFSNYNGDPPSAPQSYPDNPDVGRFDMGFTSYVDAIYRNIEVTFTPAASTAVITFQGLNLQDISDESWGLDNVRVASTTSLAQTSVYASNLPANNGTSSYPPIDGISLTFTRNLLLSTATNVANYFLREAGPNKTFGDGDDLTIATTPSFTSGKTVKLSLNPQPLQPGLYRLEAVNLVDANNNAVAGYSTIFTVENPSFGRIENTANDSIPGATALPMSTPVNGFSVGYGVGTFVSVPDADFWRFDAEAGDVVTVRLLADALGVYPQLYLQNSAGANVASAGGDYSGNSLLQTVTIPAPGTYYVAARTDNGKGAYRLRVDRAIGSQLELEPNDNVGNANFLKLAVASGNYQGSVAGALHAGDPGDAFRLGTLNTGNAITVTLSFPPGTVLAAKDVALAVMLDNTVLATNAGSLNFTATADGAYFIRVMSDIKDLRAEYVLSISIADGVAPVITSTTLPAEGATSTNIIDRLDLSLSEEVDPKFSFFSRSVSFFGGHAYFLTDNSTTWSLAEAQAISFGGHLAAINSPAENDFVLKNLVQLGGLWIGLSDTGTEGTFVWSNGDPVTFTNWNPGEPNDSGGEDFAGMFTTGLWNDFSPSSTGRGVVEVAGSDTDGDGYPDSIDPFPADPQNVFDLRAAGLDGTFGTADDVIYRLKPDSYSAGLNISLAVADGPLQPGNYRFTVTQSLRDRAGNQIAAPFVRNFSVANVAGFQFEGRNDGAAPLANTLSPRVAPTPDGSFLLSDSSANLGGNPWSVAAGDFDRDGRMDAAIALYSAHKVAVLKYLPGGGFSAVTYPVGNYPVALAAKDINGDGNLDIITANQNSSTITILIGSAGGTFTVTTNYATGSSPYAVVVGDFNGDGRMDVATANTGSHNVGVRLGAEDGTFGALNSFAAGTSPYFFAAQDLNGDGKLDFIVGDISEGKVQVLLGVGDGTFGAPTGYSLSSSTPRGLAVGDVDGDGKLDVVVIVQGDNKLNVLKGNGDGTFGAAASFPAGTSDPYALALADLNADGILDAAIASYGNARLIVMTGIGNGQFRAPYSTSVQNNPIGLAVADFNGDGRQDILTANYYGNAALLTGNDTEALLEDPAGSGIRTGAGRGNLSFSADVDYWSFSAKAGDRLVLAVDVPGNPSASSLYYTIQNGSGDNLLSFGSQYNGWGQSSPTILPADGTYFVTVQHNYDYFGEYRIRVTLAPSPVQLEAEGNDSIGSATALALQAQGNHQIAKALGYISVGDSAGDFYSLGNLSGGSVVNFSVTQPASSSFLPQVAIHNASGVQVAAGSAGAQNFSYTLPADAGGAYYARVTDGTTPASPGLFAQYILGVDISDANPPTITSTTLPAENSVNTFVSSTFSLHFSEDMLMDSLTNRSAYELRSAGVDGTFGTADDELYQVEPTTVSSLAADYLISDGPVQPGKYRFTAATSIKDRSGNSLAAPFVRNFEVQGLSGFVLENRNNNTPATASSFGGSRQGVGDGSFNVQSTTAAGGLNPWFVLAGKFNGDNHADLVVANYSGARVSVLMGNGDGSFQTLSNYSVGNGPISIAAGDLNGDGFADLAVGNLNSSSVSILMGSSTGVFSQPPTNFNIGSSPRSVALGDLNGDGKLDLVAGNQLTAGTLAVRLGIGDGTFGPVTNFPAGASPHSVILRDFNGDGKLDAAVADVDEAGVSILLGNGNGTFAAKVKYAVGQSPRSVSAADFNGDGKLDLATINAGDNNISVLLGNGDGTFQTAVNYPAGSSDPYHILAGDFNGDGKADVAVASYGNSRVLVLSGNGDGTLQGPNPITVSGNPIALTSGDFDEDGRLDLASANYGSGTVAVLTANVTELLAEDPPGSGIRSGFGRGSLANSSDVDYWRFSGKAGERVIVAAEVPGLPGASSLIYDLRNSNNESLTSFGSDYSGFGQSTPVVLPADGTYYVRISPNYNYFGEYHIRVTTLPSSAEFEREPNDALNTGTTAALRLDGGHQRARYAGYMGITERAGDFYKLGNLSGGTLIKLDLSRPNTSGVEGVLEVYNSGGFVTNSAPGATQLLYTIPAGAGDAYSVRFITIGPARAGDPGPYLSFDGSNDSVNVGAWTPGSTWSVEAWVRPSALPGSRRSIAGGVNDCRDWGITLQDNRFGVLIRPPGGCSQTLLAPDAPSLDAWYHVAGVSDGTNAFLYVNGQLAASGPVELNYIGTAAGVYIGGEVCCGGNNFPGLIDDVSIWNKPLTQADIQTHMGTVLAGSEAGLAGYWKFEEGAGTTLADATTAGHTGTFANEPAWVQVGSIAARPPGLLAQYILDFDLSDSTPPTVTGVSLPDEGSTVTFVGPIFTLNFSEDMASATVTNRANFELRGSGPDNLFGTGDDEFYTVANGDYTGGLAATFRILDGPLQPGLYRFTVKTGVTDRTGTPLAQPFVRAFAVQNLPGFVLERRGADRFVETPLAPAHLNTPDGSLGFFQNSAAGGSNPWGITAGDFNGDGFLDIAVANSGSANVGILKGIGDGRFNTVVTYPVGSGPQDVVKADFNGDGKLDFATANTSSANVSVLLGIGDATFGSRTNFAAGSNPSSIAAGDLNGDGKADLVTANSGASDISVLLGRGDGSFDAQVKIGTGANPSRAALADFNGDGFLDIAVANQGPGTVTVLPGVGNGTFGTAVSLQAGSSPRGLAVGDLNGDGRPDIVTYNAGLNNFSVILNTGGGTFGSAASFTLGTSGAYQIILADWNGDNRLDLGVADYSSGRVFVALGNGDGTFQSATKYAVSNNPIGLVAGLFDGDSLLDIATANYGNGTVGLLTGNPSEALSEDPPGSGVRSVLARGYLAEGDIDYWSFSANAGDRIQLAVETPGRPAASALFYEILGPDRQTRITYVSPNYDGWGENGPNNGPVVLPAAGTYFIAVQPSYNYYGEYNFRLTLAPPSMQVENPGQTTIVGFNAQANHLKAGEVGYLSFGDGNGDFYDLGNLAAGNAMTLSLGYPLAGGFAGIIDILSSNGLTIANSAAGQASLTFTLPSDNKYFARISGDFGASAQAFEGVPGSALRFGDHNSFARAADSASLRPGSLTLEGWVNFSSSSGVRTLFGKTVGSIYYDSYVVWYQDGYLRGAIGNSSGGSQVEKPFSPILGKWYHVAFTYDASSKVEALYVDGVLQASNTTSVTPGYDNHPFMIGAEIESEALNYLFPGKIDEVRLWNIARTGAQIDADKGRRLTGSEAGLAGYWRLDEGSGSVSLDFTANHNDLALVNFPVWVSSAPRKLTSAGFQTEYLLNIDIAPSAPATIVNTSFAGVSASSILDRFNLSFSQDMDPGTAGNSAVYDLRAAGIDGSFDTGDDQIYAVQPNSYSAGLSASFNVADGPLQPGNYRFRISGLLNRFGQPVSPFEQFFTISPLPGFTLENRTNNVYTSATPLAMVEDPTGLRSGGGRGNLQNSSDADFWSFQGTAGQKVVVAVDTVGNPNGSALYYYLLKPDRSELTSFVPVYNGYGQSSVMTLPVDGTYYVRVNAYYDYQGEYRFRVNTATAPMQLETEENNDVGHASFVTLDTSGSTKFGSVAGYIRQNSDLDYFNIGTVAAGNSIFLATRLPGGSQLSPTVSVYDSGNGYVVESGGGRAFDGVAEVRITQTGNYYAVMRGSDGTGGLADQYVMDIQVIPTGSIQFPNLQVISVTPPAGSIILSGSSNPISFTVKNIGNIATPTSSWSDRVVMSRNTILGDTDDIPLGTFPHSGALNPDDSYTVNTPIVVPDGVSGTFYIIVQTDIGNAINEFVLEGDNITVSSSTFPVTLAPYPDLKVESLAVTGPDINGKFTIGWNTANRGNKAVNTAFKEHIVVRNHGTLAELLNIEPSVTSPLPAGGLLVQSIDVTPPVFGDYDVVVATDSQNALFEMDAVSHASAEQNTVQTTFRAATMYSINGSIAPANSGSVAGFGSYADGVTATLTATPNTASLPYKFASWTENGIFQSGLTNYSFTVSGNRTLVANFVLPSFALAALVNPANGGSVSGQGTFLYGTTNVLTAQANPGFEFVNWTEAGSAVSNSSNLTVPLYTNRTFTANFRAVATSHSVSLATQPAGIASPSGAGAYLDGQTAAISTPPSVTSGGLTYTFQRFLLNGVVFGTSPSFSIGLTVTNPPSLNFIAEYDTPNIPPSVSQIQYFPGNPSGVTNFAIRLLFSREMDPSIEPLIELTNPVTAAHMIMPAGGAWSSTTFPNDTFMSAFTLTTANMNGTNLVKVSRAQDKTSLVMQTFEDSLVVDATGPVVRPGIVIVGSTSAILKWDTDEPSLGVVQVVPKAAPSVTNTFLASGAGTNFQVRVDGLIPGASYDALIFAIDLFANRTTVPASITANTTRDLEARDLINLGGGTNVLTGDLIPFRWTEYNRSADFVTNWTDTLILSNATSGTVLGRADRPSPPGVMLTPAGSAGDHQVMNHAIIVPNGPAAAGTLVLYVVSETPPDVTRPIPSLTFLSTLRSYPDLIAQNANVQPSSPTAGDLITISWEELNAGVGSVISNFHERLQVINRSIGKTNLDIFLPVDLSATGGPIGPGQVRTRTFSYQLPQGLPGAGNLEAIVTADSGSEIFELNSTSDAENNNSASRTFSSTLPALPDLYVPGVVGPTSAYAGERVSVRWTVRNQGIETATGPWKEEIFLSLDENPGNDLLLASTNFDGTLSSGAFYTHEALVDLPRNLATTNHWFIVKTDAAGQVNEFDESNNFGVSRDPVLGLPTILLSLSTNRVSESAGGTAVTGVLSRTGPVDASLTVSLNSSDTTAAIVPPNATIPAGSTSTLFTITAVDDSVIDPNQTVTFTASAGGFPDATAQLLVMDDDAPNRAPVLAAISDQTVAELSLLSVTNHATDPDFPANTLTYSLAGGAPLGLSIDPASGVLTWTPTEAQGPSVNSISIKVTDDGLPSMSTTQTFTITVTETNSAPSISPIADQSIQFGQALNIQASASDSDLPANALAFSLLTAPSGATINSASGQISWTPAVPQAGATHDFTVQAADNGTPSLTATASFKVTVGSANTAPVLDPIPDAVISEGVTFTYTARAVDHDLLSNVLTYSLGTGAPPGLGIDPGSGVLSWTPAENQGPGVFNATVIVTDNGIPPLSDSKQFKVTVREVNRPPKVNNIPDAFISEGQAYRFTATATDPDIPANRLTFSVQAGPSGLTIDSNTGEINWTPSKGQGGRRYFPTIQVTDDGNPAFNDAFTYLIDVAEVNTAPVINPIADQTINEGADLALQVTAVDSDPISNRITYSLGAGAPAGMTINSVTGLLSWHPGEPEGPSTYNITVIASDNGSPSLSGQLTFKLTVAEVNTAPVLADIPDGSVAEGATFNYSAKATDADQPPNKLTFSLSGSIPAGLSIDAASGAISWTPTESQGPNTYFLTVVVTDDGSPAKSDAKNFKITVTEGNSAPVLAAFSPVTIEEGKTLVVNSSANDPDIPANKLTFSLANAPAGMTIHPATGVISWTPDETQGGSAYTIAVTVADDGSPSLSDSKSLSVTVTEGNSAPVLGAVADQTIAEGQTLRLKLTATDSDLPSNTLRFSLGAGAPAGMTVDPLTGDLAWTPSNSDASATLSITVAVADNGSPVLSDSKTFRVTVTAVNNAPVINVPGPILVSEDTQSLLPGISISDVDAGAASVKLSLLVTNGVITIPAAPGITFEGGANSASNLVLTANLALLNQALQQLSYLPNTNFSGIDTLVIGLNDLGNTGAGGPLGDSKSLAIVVSGVDDTPMVSAIPDQKIDEGASTGLLNFGISDIDSPIEFITVSASSSNPALISIAGIQLGGTGGARTVRLVPALGQTGTAIITISANDGSSEGTTQFKLEVLPVKPVILSQSGPTTVLGGAVLSLDVTASGTKPLTYKWFLNDTLVSEQTNSPLVISNVQPVNAGTYRVQVSNAAGSANSGDIPARVNVAPSITTPPLPARAIAGENVTFKVVAAGTDLRYQWRFDGRVLDGEVQDTLLLPKVGPEAEGDYSVDVSNAAGTAPSAAARLTVLVKPAIVSPPASKTVLTGSLVKFDVAGEGTAPLTYQWKFKDAPIPGATGTTISVANAGSKDEGVYTVTVKNDAGEVTSAPATLVVQDAVIITQQPQSSTNKMGETARLNVAATGTAPLAYQWFFEGRLLRDETNAALVLPNVQAVSSGNYAVEVSNPVGPVRSSDASLKVFVPPTITREPASQIVLEGSDVLFTVIVSGTEPLSYQWRSNNVAIPGANTNTFLLQNVQTAAAASYTVFVTNYAGTALSQPVTLGVNTPVKIATPPQGGTFREGAPITLSVLATGTAQLTYQWQFDGKDIPGATASTFQLTAPRETNSGIYQVIVKNPASTNVSAEAFVNIAAPVGIVTPPVDATVRIGEDTFFSVLASGTGPLFYQWLREGVAINNATNSILPLSAVQTNQAGRYTVIVSNIVSSVTSAPGTLTVLTPPVVTAASATNQTLNLGQTAQFRVTVAGLQPITLQWLRNGEIIPDATNDTFTLPSIVATNAGIYSLVAGNAGGAANSPEFSLKLNLPTLLLTDKFQDRPLTNGASGSFLGGNNATASKEAGEQDHGRQPGGRSVWFSWQSPITGTARFRTTGSSFDTLMSVYTGTAIGNLVEVAYDDDSGGAGSSEVGFNVVAGVTYHFGIDGLAGSFGNILISWETTPGDNRPVIVTQPISQTVLVGTNVAFSVVATGTPSLTYQWYRDTARLNGQTNSVLSILNAKAGDVGSYTVRVSNGTRIVESTPAILEVTLIESGDEGPGVSAIDKPLFLRGRLQSVGGQKLRVLGSVARGYTGSQVFSTKSAVKDPGEPNHCGIVGGASSWFLYQAPTNGTLRVDTIGSDFDTILAVYTGPGTDYDSLINVACDNNSAGDVNRRLSLVTFKITAGTIYYIVVDGVSGARGTVQLNYSVVETPAIVQQPLLEILLGQQSVNSSGLQAAAGGNNLVPLGSGIKLTVGATNRLGSSPLTYQWKLNNSPLLGATNNTVTLTNLSSRQTGDYTVDVANLAGKTTSDTVHVVVTSPVVIVSPPQNVIAIAGASAKFNVVATGGQPLSYQWRFNGVNIPNATSDNITIGNVQTANAGTYSVVVANNVNSVTTSAALSFLEAPLITAQPVGATLQAGANFTLSATAAGAAPLGFQWRLNGVDIPGAAASSLALNNVGPANGGDYTLVVSNVVRSVVSAIARVNVNVPILIAQQPQSENTTPGRRAIFEVVANGTAPLSYQWKFNGAPIANATNSVFEIPVVQTNSAGSYQVSITNPAGAADSAVALLNVSEPPVITRQPQDANVSAGSLASLSVTASGTGPLQYQWRLNGNPVPGATAAVYSIGSVTEAHAGKYTVLVSNAGGQTVSSAASLIVTAGVTITAQPENQTVAAGNSATFNVVATGTGILQYQWKRNGADVPGATSATLTIANAQQANAGTYTVDISNVLGTVTSVPAVLTVQSETPVRVDGASVTANGFRLSISGPVGGAFSLEASTNLATWVALTNFTFGLDGFVFVDGESLALRSRSYRLVSRGAKQSVAIAVQSIQVADPENVRIRLSGSSGSHYVIESSVDLASWSVVAAGQFSGNQAESIQSHAPGAARLFYRARVIP